MSCPAKRKLVIFTSVFALCASVVSITVAQLRYRETELEWYTTDLGGKHIKVLVPVGWRDWEGAGGMGFESMDIRPRSQLEWMPEWLRSNIVSEVDPEECV